MSKPFDLHKELTRLKDRADSGDLMMHLIAEHIEKLEAKLKQYAERTNVFS